MLKIGGTLVVYENTTPDVIGFPDASVTAVEMFTVYNVESACPAGVNTAWLPLQEVLVHPAEGLMVTEVVLTVAQLTASFQLMVTVWLGATPTAAFAGIVLLIDEAVRSTIIVLPAPGISVFPARSVDRLFIV